MAGPPKNPEVVHLNGRILLRSCQRNTMLCVALSATVILISCMCYEYGYIATLGGFLGATIIPLVLIGMLLNYLLKICFVDGAMNSLIVRGNKGQPVSL